MAARMLESRTVRTDLAALVMLAGCVFMGVALATYDRADSTDLLSFPPPAKVANACGRSGAVLADLMLRGVGVGAYYLVLSLAILDAWLLARRPVTDSVLRMLGWSLSL